MTAAEVAQHQARGAAGRGIKTPPAASSALGDGPENRLHLEIMSYCDRQQPRWRYRHMRMDCASTESIAGAEDFTIFLPNGKTLHIEVKRLTGKLDKDQVVWKFELERLGHVVHLVRSMDEFTALVRITWREMSEQTTPLP
jgi:hypothetical protein